MEHWEKENTPYCFRLFRATQKDSALVKDFILRMNIEQIPNSSPKAIQLRGCMLIDLTQICIPCSDTRWN